MVKRFLTLLFMLLLPIAALAERPVVVDDANLFTASEETQKKSKQQHERSLIHTKWT